MHARNLYEIELLTSVLIICRTVQIWAPTTYHHLHSLTHSAPVCSLALANVLLITSWLSGSILLWNVVSGSLLLEMAPMGKVYMSGLSLASERLYGAGRYNFFASCQSYIHYMYTYSLELVAQNTLFTHWLKEFGVLSVNEWQCLCLCY